MSNHSELYRDESEAGPMTDAADPLAEFRATVRAQRAPLPRPPGSDGLVVHEEDLVWFDSAHNPARLAPVLGAPVRSFEMFLQEFVPGGSSDMQRHHHEAVHYVLSGRGHSEIGDGRYPWKTGDFVCVPPMMWHRHYNGSDTEGVRMLIIENSRLLESLGLNFRDSAGLLTWAQLVASGRDKPHEIPHEIPSPSRRSAACSRSCRHRRYRGRPIRR
jgi:quercetin dioxygenase-like cupin family protein